MFQSSSLRSYALVNEGLTHEVVFVTGPGYGSLKVALVDRFGNTKLWYLFTAVSGWLWWIRCGK